MNSFWNLDIAVLVAEMFEGLPVEENELMRPQSMTASGTRKSQQNSLAAESALGTIATDRVAGDGSRG